MLVLRPCAVALGVVFLAASGLPSSGGSAEADSGSVTMEVLGMVSAIFDGEAREWLTITGDFEGQKLASAYWKHISFDISGGADIGAQFLALAGEQVTEEERRQIEQLGSLLEGQNPMAEIFGQMTGVPGLGGGGMVAISIVGHNPSSPNILKEELLSLDITLDGGSDPATLTGQAHAADIMYVVENPSGYVPDIFYVSGEDGHPAQVVFERLELEPGGGHAAGHFEGSLCRMESARLWEGPNLSDCILVEGNFHTTLVEE